MPFLKEDLARIHYTWNNNDSPLIFNGRPSRRYFDRYNGDQVLFIINSWEALSSKFDIEEGRKIENIIANHLPIEAKSEISVFNWLKETLDREKTNLNITSPG